MPDVFGVIVPAQVLDWLLLVLTIFQPIIAILIGVSVGKFLVLRLSGAINYITRRK